jgi:hypothetical protein
MRRLAALALLALVLAGCNRNREPVAGPPPEPGSVTAGFDRGGATDVIHVRSLGRYAMRGADLVAPNGTVVASEYSLDAARDVRSATTGGVLYPSDRFVAGLNPGPGSAALMTPGEAAASVSSNDIQSNAYIRLPDPVGYGQNWQGWKIRVRLGEPPGNLHVVTLDAPPPP